MSDLIVVGTTFPFMGGRGDVALGGYGNITSYDFGGAPIGAACKAITRR